MSASPFADCQTVEVNGTSLTYKETGASSNPNLVLLHGHISDLRSFGPLQELLTPYFHVISYSRRFAVPNKPVADNEGEDWYQHADDLAALIQTLKLLPCHVLGNSSGGTIVLLLAQKYPELLKSIIVEEPVVVTLFLPNLPPGIGDVLKLLWNYPWAFLPIMKFGGFVIGPVTNYAKTGDNEAMLKVFGPGACGVNAWERMKNHPERMAQARENLKWLGNFYKYSTLPVISVEDARKIQVPALVLAGADTIAVSKCNNWLLAKELPKSREDVLVPKAEHLIHEDNPAGVMEAVVAFIRGLE